MSEKLYRPLSTHDVAWTEWSDVPNFAVRYKHLSLAALGEDYRIGVAIEELPAGMQSAPAHYHMLEEEHLFVLEGELVVRLGHQRHAMKAGDYICFPAGQKSGHCLLNEGDRACRYVIIGEKNPNDVIVYTDSNKVLVRSLGRRAILDADATRSYWEGERTGLLDDCAPPDDRSVMELSPETEPKPPIASENVAWDHSEAGNRFGGNARHLTYAAIGNDYHVGVLIEAPDTGKRLAPLHYHMREEEHALILDGRATLLLGDETFDMAPGDYVAFPAGRKVGHSLMNSGSGPLRYLIIGARDPADVCVYPDSGKIAVNALKTKDCIFETRDPKNYWDGEI